MSPKTQGVLDRLSDITIIVESLFGMRAKFAALALAILSLCSCGTSPKTDPQATAVTGAAALRPIQSDAPAEESEPTSTVELLEPLPPKDTVLSALGSSGRPDPFAPIEEPLKSTPVVLSSSGASSPEQLAELKITGLLSINNKLAAFVVYKGVSGEVLPGRVGGKSTPFLPDGWQIQQINTKYSTVVLVNKETGLTAEYRI